MKNKYALASVDYTDKNHYDTKNLSFEQVLFDTIEKAEENINSIINATSNEGHIFYLFECKPIAKYEPKLNLGKIEL